MHPYKKGKSKFQSWGCMFLVIIGSNFIAIKTFAQQKDRTWSTYKADAASSNYSPLDQINVSNVSQLKPAWK